MRTVRVLIIARGFAVIGLGLGIGLDELVIGFSLSFTRLPPTEVLVAAAFQALLAVRGGTDLAARIVAMRRPARHRRVDWSAMAYTRIRSWNDQ